jgi:hypothetical protein
MASVTSGKTHSVSELNHSMPVSDHSRHMQVRSDGGKRFQPFLQPPYAYHCRRRRGTIQKGGSGAVKRHGLGGFLRLRVELASVGLQLCHRSGCNIVSSALCRGRF